MSIKIDLLPGHVKQRRTLQTTIISSVFVLALVGTGLAMALNAKQKELLTAQADRDVVKAIAAQTTEAETAKTASEASMKPISDTVLFMLASSKSGPQRAALLNQVRQYIYVDTVVKSIDLSDGINANIEGQVKSPTEYAQFLFNLRRAGPAPTGAPTTDAGPLFSAAPKASGVGGFNNGAAIFVPPAAPTDQPVIVVYPLIVKATGPLKYPVPAIPDPVGAAGAPGAVGGVPGGPPGGPSSLPPGPPPGPPRQPPT